MFFFMNEVYCYFNKIQKGFRGAEMFSSKKIKNGAIYLLLWCGPTQLSFRNSGSFQTAPDSLPFLASPVHPACARSFSPYPQLGDRRCCHCCWYSSIVGPFARLSSGLRRRRAPARYALFASLSAVRNRASELGRNMMGSPLLSGCRITRQNSLNWRNLINLLLFYQPILFSLHRWRRIKSVVYDPPRISLEYSRVYAPVKLRIRLPCMSMFLSA